MTAATQKTVLAFGDSLTWGAAPDSGRRHDHGDRWPNVLATGLRGLVRVIEEGLGGRTTAFDDYTAAYDRNGSRVLPILLASHSPLDLVIIMLGTNDLKPHICGSAFGAAQGMNRLVEVARTFPFGLEPQPEVLVVAPPLFRLREGGEAPRGDRDVEESRRLATAYREVADAFGCAFFDAATVATASPIDGVHLDAEQTRAIGFGLVPVVNELLGLG